MQTKIATWNIRGAHSNLKLDQVKKYISDNNLCLIGLLETKLSFPLSQKAVNYINPSWSFHHNHDVAAYGRILVMYNPSEITLSPILMCRQSIHYHILLTQKQTSFYLTIVYADNSNNSRNTFLKTLPPLRQASHPWLVMGDFNSCFDYNDKFGGIPLTPRDLDPLNQSVIDSELLLVNKSGAKYSWNNRSRSGVRTFTTIDHSFCNFQALSLWPNLSVYLPHPILSDHSPQILSLGNHLRRDKRSFKFFNAWAKHEHFLVLVSHVNAEFKCFGNPMFKFCRKLKSIKHAIKQWATATFGSGGLLSATLAQQLKIKQDFMMEHPLDVQAADEERQLFLEVNSALKLEANMKRQQLNKKWHDEGDKNTKFYHDSIKVKQARENIHCITDDQGLLHSTPDSVDHAFIQYFTKQYGNQEGFIPSLSLISETVLPHITNLEASFLVRPVTDDEIKSTLFSMNKQSTGGPDGLNVVFFINTWNILGSEFCKAIHNFFNKCKILGEINCTNIALIPKCSPASTVSSYRPISCCNVVYKCISKILAARLVSVLPTVVSTNQSAFLPNRDIIDNVLLAQELLKSYGRSYGPPAAALKIDITKAYDSIHWDSIVRIMAVMGFPKTFVSWIYVCISTPSYSVVINGRPVGSFRGSKGIRQGDPLSSYLFLIVMEVLTVTLRTSYNNKIIKYHPKCNQQQITSIMFADDVMVFTKPELPSLKGINEALQNFYKMTGLSINQSKSSMLVSGISHEACVMLHHQSGFSSMENDMKYLGIPLITKRITKNDCYPLYHKITSLMTAWENRKLTQSGRLVLIKTVVFSSVVYWARAMILPVKLLQLIRSAVSRFFWTGSIHNRKIVPCAFSKFEVPFKTGGLGILDIRKWNIAAISKQFNAIIKRRKSLWVEWTWQHNIKNRNFWIMEIPQLSSWTWRSILKCRKVFLPLIQYSVNTSNTVNFWNEPWVSKGLILSTLFSYSQIVQSGIPLSANVNSYFINGKIQLPYSSNNFIQQTWSKIHHTNFSALQASTVHWNSTVHTVKVVYKSLVVSDSLPAADWHEVIWNSDSVPQYNLMMWKVINSALLTRKLLHKYGMNCPTWCLFCEIEDETPEHIFFECPALHVLLSKLGRISGSTLSGHTNIIQWRIIYKATKWKTDASRIITVCLKVYMAVIWRERNIRVFENTRRNENDLWNEMKSCIYKLLKNSAFPLYLVQKWA
jgi:exonuclease III